MRSKNINDWTESREKFSQLASVVVFFSSSYSRQAFAAGSRRRRFTKTKMAAAAVPRVAARLAPARPQCLGSGATRSFSSKAPVALWSPHSASIQTSLRPAHNTCITRRPTHGSTQTRAFACNKKKQGLFGAHLPDVDEEELQREIENMKREATDEQDLHPVIAARRLGAEKAESSLMSAMADMRRPQREQEKCGKFHLEELKNAVKQTRDGKPATAFGWVPIYWSRRGRDGNETVTHDGLAVRGPPSRVVQTAVAAHITADTRRWNESAAGEVKSAICAVGFSVTVKFEMGAYDGGALVGLGSKVTVGGGACDFFFPFLHNGPLATLRT